MAEPLGLDDDRTPTPRFLTVDARVPEPIRQLLEEADGCLNMTFSVGGSACARRAIRKTFDVEGVDEGDFAASTHALAQKHQGVAPTLFQVIELLGTGEEPLHADAPRRPSSSNPAPRRGAALPRIGRLAAGPLVSARHSPNPQPLAPAASTS